jgi:hypothetical protein
MLVDAHVILLAWFGFVGLMLLCRVSFILGATGARRSDSARPGVLRRIQKEEADVHTCQRL